MIEQIIIVSGDPGGVYICITDASRPDPAHAWSRAASHIFRFKDLNYFTAIESATMCRHMVEAILKIPRRPRGMPVAWGWGKGWPGCR